MQAANAQQAQQNAQNQQRALWGQYNPATGGYSGGSASAFLDPSQLNTQTLQGPYAAQYKQQSNQLANDTQNAVQTTNAAQNSRGMGATPSGYGADQMRQAYQESANQRGKLFSDAFSGQHNEALGNYWNATNLLNSNFNTNLSSATANNSGASGTYGNLYGTASQQKQSPWGAILGAGAGLAGAAATAYAGR